jgi:redox-sensitive bicupin YhaK (pirin superfamily)
MMSDFEIPVESQSSIASTEDVIELVLTPREKDLGGFSVRRLLPSAKRKAVGPWVFFDHMGPALFPAGKGVNVRPHPHINLATVTYLFEGEMLHRDSLGSLQVIRPGDINLMLAGSGIVHSERERPEVRNVEHRLHGLQLWLALPEDSEEVDAWFYHYPAEKIPFLKVDDVPLRVMMGSAYGVESPVITFADTLYVEAHLQAGQQLLLPYADERAVYVAQGSVNINGVQIKKHSMALVSSLNEVVLQADEESRVAILGGETLGKRYIEWNFVSSSRARIEQAKKDWRAGRFPKVPGDEEEFIPLPED